MNVSKREFYLLIFLLVLVWIVFGRQPSDFELHSYQDIGLARINKKTGDTFVFLPTSKSGGWTHITETSWGTVEPKE